jgi:hypothetical protein
MVNPGGIWTSSAGFLVPAHAALAGLHHEDPEAAQLDPIASREGSAHRLDDGLDGNHRLLAGHISCSGNAVDEVVLDHPRAKRVYL